MATNGVDVPANDNGDSPLLAILDNVTFHVVLWLDCARGEAGDKRNAFLLQLLNAGGRHFGHVHLTECLQKFSGVIAIPIKGGNLLSINLDGEVNLLLVVRHLDVVVVGWCSLQK